MPNNVQLMDAYIPILDEEYQSESLTAILDTDPNLIKVQGGNLRIPVMATSGLRNHDRATGGTYKDGNVNLFYATKEPNYDRNIKFTVDSMDDFETKEVAFGMLSGHFIKHQATPEIDAFRLAAYVATTVLNTNRVEENYADGEEALEGLRKARTYFDERKVPVEDRVLYAQPALINAIEDLDTIKSRRALESFGTIVKVPSDRFFQDVALQDDAQGGFVGNGDVNFLAIHKGAVIQGYKHVAPKYIPAEANQTADGNTFAYRVYGIAEVYDSKSAEGIYASIPV